MPARNPVFQLALTDYNADFVRVSHEAITRLAPPERLEPLRPLLAGTPLARRSKLAVAFLITMGALNYQFWELSGGGELRRYAVGSQVGAWAMQSAFLNAWVQHMGEVADGMAGEVASVERAVAGIRAQLEAEGLESLFGDIPAPESRRRVLDEVLYAPGLLLAAGSITSRAFDARVLSWGDAQFLRFVFPESFGDPYLKKAQLTLMFVAAEARGASVPVRLDVTAAADYQLPKVLRALGVLEYCDALARRVDAEDLVPENSAQERAIRAATVLACEALAKHFDVGVEAVDSWLWLQRNVAKDAKFHLTETTRY